MHHSDRGSQYLSMRYTDRLAEAGIAPSVGSRGDSYDNALAESTIGARRDPWDNDMFPSGFRPEHTHEQGSDVYRHTVGHAGAEWARSATAWSNGWSLSRVRLAQFIEALSGERTLILGVPY